MVLYGGWLLLFNPNDHQPSAPLSAWEKVGDHDTAYECEQERREEVKEALEKDAKKRGVHMTETDAQLRYRCERAEVFAPLKRR